VQYLTESGLSIQQLNRGGYTIRTTLDPTAMAQTKTAVDAEVPPQQPHVADAMAIVAPGKDKHRVLALAANRRFGLKADQKKPATDCPTSQSTWAPDPSTRSSPPPSRWRRAWASTT
jgi:membrane peptidoglycan carboxypeptidase